MRLEQLAKQVVHGTLKQGAKEAAVSVRRSRSIEMVQRDGRLERVRESSSTSLRLSVYTEGRYSQHSTSDLRTDALSRFIGQAIEMTRALEPDEHRGLVDPRYYEGRHRRPLEIRDPDYERIDTEQRAALVAAVEAGGKRPSGPILSVRARYQDDLSEWARVHSNGFEDEDSSTGFWISAATTVDDDGKKPEDYHYIGGRFFSDVQQPEDVGQAASLRALARRGQKTLPSGTMTVVVENRTASRLLEYLLAAMQGGALQQKQSFLQGKKGKSIGSSILTLVDHPLLPKGLGSRRFDGDGMSLAKRTLVDSGKLQDYLIGPYYARKLGVEPTGATTGNLIIPPGRRSREELYSAVGSGLLITGFLGGNADPTSGDFSHGFKGFEIVGGKLGDPVGEMNITGSHTTLWSKLVHVGSDPHLYSSRRLPSLVFEDVSVSGA